MSGQLEVAAFDYDLPPQRIAQVPAPRRDASRLMALDRRTGGIEHLRFPDLAERLRSGDLLVLNDTRVIPARLRGRRVAPGTGGRIEALLVERLESARGGEAWLAMWKGVRREGDSVDFGSGLHGVVGPVVEDGMVRLELRIEEGAGDVGSAIEAAGVMPVPPYIHREPMDPREHEDRERYQTVYAAAPGAVAAPTAGLHFTRALLDEVRARGVIIETLTLHVGPGTFRPVRSSRVEDHRLQPERYVIPDRLARAVAETRRRRGRVVAVGTTVTRALEARTGAESGCVAAGEGRCDLFIYPGYRFRVVDALVTNFHLPRSTLLMLVCAFAGRERVLAAYAEAVNREYRFYSYGDAMLVA